jgi:branched-chain amino acid transport system ATP-binding protein
VTSLLEISGLVAGYGAVSVLHDLALHVKQHEAVALVGANAAGKTTLLRTISGIVPARAGSIRLEGRELIGLGSHEIAAAGIVQVAEGRQLFPEMSVLENLELGAMASSEAWSGRAEMMARVIALFPRVGERLGQRAGTMSGGEQQQVAIGRALMARPKILLVDEPSAGLSPLLVQTVFRALREIHAEGTTILLVEQNVPLSLRLAQRAYVIELGRVVLEGTGKELLANPHVQAAYLGRA